MKHPTVFVVHFRNMFIYRWCVCFPGGRVDLGSYRWSGCNIFCKTCLSCIQKYFQWYLRQIILQGEQRERNEELLAKGPIERPSREFTDQDSKVLTRTSVHHQL